MDQPLLTRCPHCRTLFHIRQEDLDIANGTVRCGLCLEAFDAIIQASVDKNSPPTEPATQQTAEDSEQVLHSSTMNPGPFDPKPDQHGDRLRVNTDKKLIPLLRQELIPSGEEINALEIGLESIDSILATRRRQPGRRVLWLGLSLAALLLLAAQWAWFNRTELSQEPRLRPWYILLCSQLNCSIPVYQAISQIRTEGLTIRADPGQSQQLIVDLIIINEAHFDQPLPGLTLQFFDLNQNLLAQRTFQPAEYLNPSSFLKNMPVNVAVHISFSIIDPGQNAVNYAVQITASTNNSRKSHSIL